MRSLDGHARVTVIRMKESAHQRSSFHDGSSHGDADAQWRSSDSGPGFRQVVFCRFGGRPGNQDNPHHLLSLKNWWPSARSRAGAGLTTPSGRMRRWATSHQHQRCSCRRWRRHELTFYAGHSVGADRLGPINCLKLPRNTPLFVIPPSDNTSSAIVSKSPGLPQAQVTQALGSA